MSVVDLKEVLIKTQLQANEGIDAVIVDSVLKIRKGLTVEESTPTAAL